MNPALWDILEGTAAAAPFAPTDLSGLALWFDASDASTVTLDGSNNVSQWNDKSGNGKNAAQTDTLKKPSYVASAINGLASCRFDGVNDCLQAASVSLNGVVTIFVVSKLTTANPLFIEHGPNTNSSDGFFVYGYGAPAMSRRYLAEGSNVNVAAYYLGSSVGVATFRVLSPTVNSKRFQIRLNGADVTQTSGSNGVGLNTTVTDTLNIGSRNNGSAVPSSGDYCEIVIYDRSLNATEITSVESYLKTKWGTP